MKSTRSKETFANTRQVGFTMVELLAVITIIAMMVAVVLGVAGYAKQRTNISRAQLDIGQLSMAIEKFKIDNGQYPTSGAVRALDNFSGAGTNIPALSPVVANAYLLYQQLVSPQRYINFRPSQLMVYTNTAVVVFGGSTNFFLPFTFAIDPWSHPYNYYRTYPVQTDQVNQATFDLWSSGPNGRNENGGGDDLTNWRR